MWNRRILIPVVAIVASIPILGASCSVDQTFTDSGAPKIQFEGDSITFYETDDINSSFGSSYDVAINAFIGATSYERRNGIASDATQRPQVAVINLGTNDASVVIDGRGGDVNGTYVELDPVEPIEHVGTRLDDIAAEFSPACVVFVTIDSQATDFYGSGAAVANVQALNAHIRSMPGVEVADWDANLQPAYFDQPGLPRVVGDI